MRILAIDPSGNFKQGKGTTGWVIGDENRKIYSYGALKADDFQNERDYWIAHTKLIDMLKPNAIVIEDYLLYANKAKAQINSRFETSKLIGIIEVYCYTKHIPIHFQQAREVKKRWDEKILVHRNMLQHINTHYYLNGSIVNNHIRDALKHYMHFITFKLKKGARKE